VRQARTATLEEIDMTGRMTLVTLAATAALGLLAAAAIAKDDIDNRGERGGSVTL
jgi:hypothetical protein